MKQLAYVWQFRYFVIGSIVREFQSKYRNSILGLLWIVLPSIAQILIYTLVFSALIGARLPGVDSGVAYGVYLCAGFVAWGLFTEVVTKSTTVFIDNANMIKKLVFPRSCLLAIVLGNALANFFVLLAVFMVFLGFLGWPTNRYMLAVIPMLAIQVFASLGLGLMLGVANVFIRDVGQLTSIALQFWFWLTPIVYPISILPDFAKTIVSLNPLTPVVSAYHDIFVYQRMPDWSSLWPTLMFGFVMTIVALRVYRRSAPHLVDEL